MLPRPLIQICFWLMMLGLLNTGLFGQSNSNYTAIRNANIQIKASLNHAPLAWASESVDLKLNKQTGEFEVVLHIGDLYLVKTQPDFKSAAENQDKLITISGLLPVDDVLHNANNAIDRKVEMEVACDDMHYPADFTFTILTLQTGGFSVMANGTVSLRALQIVNLSGLDDEVQIILSFTGY